MTGSTFELESETTIKGPGNITNGLALHPQDLGIKLTGLELQPRGLGLKLTGLEQQPRSLEIELTGLELQPQNSK